METKGTRPSVFTTPQQEQQERQRQAQERARQEQERQAEERERARREQELQAYAQEWDRQERERKEREQRYPLAGFTRVDDGVYVNTKTREIAIKLIITYRNDDELWDFYLNHREELDAFIREKVPEISGSLRVKEIQVTKGSIILTIITVAISVASLVVSAVAAYPAAKTLYKDLKPVILDFLRRWFGSGGPEIQPG